MNYEELFIAVSFYGYFLNKSSLNDFWNSGTVKQSIKKSAQRNMVYEVLPIILR